MEPLWLVYVLGGATGATEQGEDEVGRRLSVTVDMSRASGARPGGLSVPASDRFEDLLALRFDVWLDSIHVRRVQFMRPVCEGATCGSTVTSLHLHEFGVDVEAGQSGGVSGATRNDTE